MAEKYSLKDELFNLEKIRYLEGLFHAADPSFPAEAFTKQVMSQLLDLELKARAEWIADCLAEVLPRDVEALFTAIEKALPPPLDPNSLDDDFGDFIFWPLGEVVVRAGLDGPARPVLDMLEALTQRFTMEFPIRAVLNRWPDATLARMEDWAMHPSSHVRRLASEGSRPKLPWGQGIGLAVEAPLPILDRLHGDRARYVTRSVANHLNDITKTNPDLVMDRLEAWQKASHQTPKELDYMTRHALRSLIKAGHPRALEILGYKPDADVVVSDLTITPSPVAIDQKAQISFSLSASTKTPVLVDYVIDFMKSNGKTAPKVFKLKQAVVVPDQPLVLTKAHLFKGGATTFRLYPGAHRLHVQVNGRIRASVDFDLTSA
ncbi:hypothetical protein [Algirhabdus cladophorae]|uniref:hypothetical protein n=1 Tax=Algirhabdus cladophorae TaxID=3377108 RepID=UPI003B84579A